MHIYGSRNTGGAAIAATRLHKALLRSGADSHVITVWQREDGTNVHVLPQMNTFGRRLHFYGVEFTRRLLALFSVGHKKFYTNLIPLPGLDRELKRISPDVVHVHWINEDTVSLSQLTRIKCPIVLHLHDLYMINAIKPYPEEDVRYRDGFTVQNSTWAERWMFNRKRRAIKAICSAFIAPSKWAAKLAQESSIGRDCETYVVSNLIGDGLYFDAKLRTAHTKMVLLFGALGGRQDPMKGWEDLVSALDCLPDKIRNGIEIKVFGETAEESSVANGVKVSFLGCLKSTTELRAAYHQADVFVFPSRYETQGMTKVEALLCGVPVIAFNRSACAEGVEHKVTGYIADDGDVSSFAEGIEYYFELFRTGGINTLHNFISNRMNEKYSTDKIVQDTIAVYERLLKR